MIAQVAGLLLLLVFATQIFRGASILLSSPVGFRAENLLTAGFNPTLARETMEQSKELYRQLLDQARTLGGLVAGVFQSPLVGDSICGRTVRVCPVRLQKLTAFHNRHAEGAKVTLTHNVREHFTVSVPAGSCTPSGITAVALIPVSSGDTIRGKACERALARTVRSRRSWVWPSRVNT